MGKVDIDRVLYLSIFMYIILMALIIFTKPRIMYDEQNKKLRCFGFDEDETLLSLPIVGILLSLCVYITIIAYSRLLSTLE